MRKILFVVITLLLTLFLSFSVVIFDFNFYKKEFERYGVYNKLGKENVDKIVIELIDYFKGKNKLEDEVFSDREKLHLMDVKNLIRNNFLIFNFLLVSFILLMGYSIYKKDKVGSYFIISGLVTFLLILIIFLLVRLNFDFIFTQFHYLVFNNDLWLLNEEDILINLFPLDFFYDIIIRIFLISCIYASIFIIIGILFNRFSKTIDRK